MCKLLGVSYGGKPEALTTSEIAAILFTEQVRGGPHAFGWMSYNDSSKDLSWAKSPGRVDEIENLDWILDEVDDAAEWFVGHVRYATNGSPEDNRNNHPIWHGNICGVHNGVLKDWEPIIEETGRQEEGAEVDSEAIFAAVNKWGREEGLKKIEGAMVTLFADIAEPHRLFLGRSNGRSISLGWTTNGNLIWASDEWALWALEPQVKFIRISKVSENRLLEIRYGDIVDRVRFRPIPPKPVVVPATMPSFALDDDDAWIDYQVRQIQNRAKRRGEKLFPKGRPSQKQQKPKPRPMPKVEEPVADLPPKLRGKDGSRKLVYLNGSFVTPEMKEQILSRSN